MAQTKQKAEVKVSAAQHDRQIEKNYLKQSKKDNHILLM
jgi:hypothetical protein